MAAKKRSRRSTKPSAQETNATAEEEAGGEERRDYGQFWGMRSGSGLVLGSGHGLAVAEADTANDLGEAVGAVQPAPVALG